MASYGIYNTITDDTINNISAQMNNSKGNLNNFWGMIVMSINLSFFDIRYDCHAMTGTYFREKQVF